MEGQRGPKKRKTAEISSKHRNRFSSTDIHPFSSLPHPKTQNPKQRTSNNQKKHTTNLNRHRPPNHLRLAPALAPATLPRRTPHRDPVQIPTVRVFELHECVANLLPINNHINKLSLKYYKLGWMGNLRHKKKTAGESRLGLSCY